MPAKPSCPTHCPKYGKPGQITIERTFGGSKAVTQCACTGRCEPCRLRHRPGRHSRVHPHTDNATTDTQLVESVKSVAAAQVERITQLVRDLAQTESGSTEGELWSDESTKS
jgi:hypothetical protein